MVQLYSGDEKEKDLCHGLHTVSRRLWCVHGFCRTDGRFVPPELEQRPFVPYHKSTSEFCGSGGGEGKTSLSCLGERTSLCESFLLLGVQYSAQVGMVAGVGKCQNAFPVKQKYI